MATLPTGASPALDLVRKEYKVRLTSAGDPIARSEPFVRYAHAQRTALQAARRTLLAMRRSGDIGDDAFHAVENELDWMEVSDPLRGANADDIR